MKRRSVSSNIYHVLKIGTQQGAIEWERVGKTDNKFATVNPIGGKTVELARAQIETATEDDDGLRWVVSHGEVNIPLNRKQQVLAREIREQIDGTSDQRLMQEADELAEAFASELGIDVFDDEAEDDDEEVNGD